MAERLPRLGYDEDNCFYFDRMKPITVDGEDLFEECNEIELCAEIEAENDRLLEENAKQAASLCERPTVWAYEQVCAALRKHKTENIRLRKAPEELLHAVDRSDFRSILSEAATRLHAALAPTPEPADD